MSEPVFSEVCYTGQPMTQNEEVLCPVCKDHSSLLHLRYNAWYDVYCSEPRIKPQIPGVYVHFNCLSEQRKQELREVDDLSPSIKQRLKETNEH